MKALLLVDIQNDFLPGGALAVPKGDAIVPVVNQIAEDYPLVAATQDWHPPGHLSFASSHQGQESFEKIELEGLEQTLWPDHCVWDTEGAAFAGELNTGPISAIFRKGMDPHVDSYSGFYDNGKRHRTGLAEFLRAHNVDAVDIAGLAAEVCVTYTARDAAELGFAVTVLANATRALDNNAFGDCRQELQNKGVSFAQA